MFLPADPLTSAEVERVHKGAIVRIRRVLERHGLDPIALGLPLRQGDEASWEYADSSAHEQPLLDYGDASDGSFFPSPKAASVKSLAPSASLRDDVVPRPVVRKEAKELKDADAADEDASLGPEEPPARQRYIRWADLLERVFPEDVLRCKRCRGRRHMISVI